MRGRRHGPERRRRAGGRQGRLSARWLLLAVPGLLLVLLAGAALYFAPVFSLIGQRENTLPSTGPSPAATPPPPLDASHRINILLLGSDNDQKFSPDAVLSQTMIVASLDPAHHQVVLLSLPRDLWVDIPGHGTAKIDAAYALGGPALARRTVEMRFKIPIHYYAWVGLNGLVRVIDRLGGVDVDVLHPVIDDAYPDDLGGDPYGVKRLHVAAGPQHLDGARALEYVRSRHGDLLSDFGRSLRQQQILVALQQRTATTNLLTDLPNMAKDLNGHVKTDLDVVRVAQLVYFFHDLRREDVRQAYLFSPLVHDARSSDGQEILLPNWPAISKRVHELFGDELLP